MASVTHFQLVCAFCYLHVFNVSHAFLSWWYIVSFALFFFSSHLQPVFAETFCPHYRNCIHLRVLLPSLAIPPSLYSRLSTGIPQSQDLNIYGYNVTSVRKTNWNVSASPGTIRHVEQTQLYLNPLNRPPQPSQRHMMSYDFHSLDITEGFYFE